MRTVLRHAGAEGARLARDPGALLVLVGAVVLYAFFYPLPYRPEVLREVPVAVVDLDHTAPSRLLVRMAEAHSSLRVAARPDDLESAETLLRRGSVGGVLLIPAGFQDRLLSGRQARVGVFADASTFLVYRQVATGFVEAIGTLSAGVEVRRLQARGYPEAAAGGRRQPVTLVARSLFNPTEGYASCVVPGVLILILQQTLLIGIGLLGGTEAEDRGRSRVRNAGVPGLALLGRASFYLLLYAVHLAFLFGVVHPTLGLPQRAAAFDLAAFGLPFLLACVFLAQALSHAFRRRETALQVLLFTSLPAVFLAGFVWPRETLPTWLRAVSLLLPSTTGVDGFHRLSTMGASLRHVRGEWLTLWALAFVYLLLAWRLASAPPGARHARGPGRGVPSGACAFEAACRGSS